MRVFHHLLFDGYVVDDPQYSEALLVNLLANVDTLHISGFTSHITGTSPTLTVGVFASIDGQNWTVLEYPIAALGLSTSDETLFQGKLSNPASNYKARYVRLIITLGGTSPRGNIKLWVTGRDKSRRARGLGNQIPSILSGGLVPARQGYVGV